MRFPHDPDGVDPERVPKRTLRSGARLPVIGLGTFGSDHVPSEAVAEAVRGAARVGYRHFDCAAVYGNESPNEMELHPHFQDPVLFRFVTDHDIVPIGYCPIGSPARPERDRTPSDTVDIEDPVMIEIARAHGVHPATLCVKWALQRGQVPIPFSTTRSHYLANLKATLSDPLSEAEMAALEGIDRGCRLIKGQVFLWKEHQSWEDLWDPHGFVTPP